MTNKINPDGGFRTNEEREAAIAYGQTFEKCPDSLEDKLANFPKYVRRQNLTRLFSLYELFKQILNIKGSIIECGVYRGFSLMSWANFSSILEPSNLTRRIYGFDTFSGFSKIDEKDSSQLMKPNRGDLGADSYDELIELTKIYDSNRYLGHIPKVHLIKGNAEETIPKFIADNAHLVVSLLYLDFDLYEPTKTAIEYFVPRMGQGSVLAFDELDNPIWPGETQALLDTLGLRGLELRRFEWDPYVAYTIIK